MKKPAQEAPKPEPAPEREVSETEERFRRALAYFDKRGVDGEAVHRKLGRGDMETITQEDLEKLREVRTRLERGVPLRVDDAA